MRVLQGVSAVRCFHISIPKPSFSACRTPVAFSGLPGSIASYSAAALRLRARQSRWAAHYSKLVSRNNLFVCMATTAPVEVLVKAAVDLPDQLGDCPFSQRVLLTLEEKGIPYEVKFVDTSNKPGWFLEANPEGKVPVIKNEGKWVADSDVITELLEEKFPDPPLTAPPSPVGSKLFGSFIQFLISKDPSDGKEQALLDELKTIDAHLKSNGPYLNGEKISSLDLAIAPKLYHVKVALGHYKKWSIPSEFGSLNSYIEALHSRESFIKTKSKEEFVVKGWESKVNSA